MHLEYLGIQLKVFENSQALFSEAPFGAVVIDLYDLPHSELVHDQEFTSLLAGLPNQTIPKRTPAVGFGRSF